MLWSKIQYFCVTYSRIFFYFIFINDPRVWLKYLISYSLRSAYVRVLQCVSSRVASYLYAFFYIRWHKIESMTFQLFSFSPASLAFAYVFQSLPAFWKSNFIALTVWSHTHNERHFLILSISTWLHLNAFVPDNISARAVNVPQPHERRMLRIALSVWVFL